MRRTWGILIIALAFLLAYPFAYQRIPFLNEHFTSFNLLNGVMDKKEAKKLVENGIVDLEPTTIGTEVEIDTTMVVSISTSVPMVVGSRSTIPFSTSFFASFLSITPFNKLNEVKCSFRNGMR